MVLIKTIDKQPRVWYNKYNKERERKRYNTMTNYYITENERDNNTTEINSKN